MLVCNRGPPLRPEYYVELENPDSFCTNELAIELHITTFLS
jgi:hypothetical protein